MVNHSLNTPLKSKTIYVLHFLNLIETKTCLNLLEAIIPR